MKGPLDPSRASTSVSFSDLYSRSPHRPITINLGLLLPLSTKRTPQTSSSSHYIRDKPPTLTSISTRPHALIGSTARPPVIACRFLRLSRQTCAAVCFPYNCSISPRLHARHLLLVQSLPPYANDSDPSEDSNHVPVLDGRLAAVGDGKQQPPFQHAQPRDLYYRNAQCYSDGHSEWYDAAQIAQRLQDATDTKHQHAQHQPRGDPGCSAESSKRFANHRCWKWCRETPK